MTTVPLFRTAHWRVPVLPALSDRRVWAMLGVGRMAIAVCIKRIHFHQVAMDAAMPVNARETLIRTRIRMDLMPLPSRGISEEAVYCGPVPLPLPVTVISTVTMTVMVPMPSFSKRTLEEASF